MRSELSRNALVPPLLAILYGLAHLIWYWQTPLGLQPVLDGAENLHLAQAIASGTLSDEPFYRAMLYPGVLALFLKAGVSAAVMPIVAGLLNLLCHALSAFFVSRLALGMFRNDEAALLAGALYAVYPVSIHFVGDPLDITLGITFFLGSLVTGLDRSRTRQGWSMLAVSGVLMGLAVLTRPHFLTAAVILPLAILVQRGVSGGFRRWLGPALCPAAGLVVVLLAGGLANLAHSDVFKILPWQGAYNLYAANLPATNGRYFEQTLYIDDPTFAGNPTRLESEVLFQRQTGKPADEAGVEAMSNYWRSRALEVIAQNPLDWAALMLRKVYYLVNNFEHYNNKTYRFHKQRSPVLWWNPLGWGLLLLLAAAGLQLSGKWKDRTFLALLLAGAAYAGGVLLFFVSARFRLPLAPLLCAGVGGTVCLRASWRRLGHWRFLVPTVAVVALSFTPFFGVWSEETYVADEVLIANAAARLGRDAEALQWAEAALARDPARPDALRIATLSWYNLLITGQVDPSHADWMRLGQRVQQLESDAPPFPLLTGLALWNTGRHLDARDLWQDYATQPGSLAALLLTGGVDAAEIDPLQVLAATNHPLLAYAIDPELSENPEEAAAVVERLLGDE